MRWRRIALSVTFARQDDVSDRNRCRVAWRSDGVCNRGERSDQRQEQNEESNGSTHAPYASVAFAHHEGWLGVSMLVFLPLVVLGIVLGAPNVAPVAARVRASVQVGIVGGAAGAAFALMAMQPDSVLLPVTAIVGTGCTAVIGYIVRRTRT